MWITLNDSSVSAVQFTAEKSEFKCLATTVNNIYVKLDSNIPTLRI